MNAPHLTAAARITLTVGAVATLASLIHAGGNFSILLDRFTLWALLPNALLFAASLFADTHDRARTLLFVCALTTLATLLVLGDLFFLRRSSESFLFLFVWLYEVAAATILLMAQFLTHRSAASKPDAA